MTNSKSVYGALHIGSNSKSVPLSAMGQKRKLTL